MAGARRIDVHFHLIPKFYQDAVYEAGRGPAIGRFPDWTPELSLEIMDRFEIGTALTSLAQPGVQFLPQAAAKVQDALQSGRALEKFRDMIGQQGGNAKVVDNYDLLPSAPHRALVQAEHSGYVTTLDAELFGRATMVLGAGRNRIEDVIDPAVGAMVLKTLGEQVQAGESLAELHYRDQAQLEEALGLVHQAYQISEAPLEPLPQILEFVSSEQ